MMDAGDELGREADSTAIEREREQWEAHDATELPSNRTEREQPVHCVPTSPSFAAVQAEEAQLLVLESGKIRFFVRPRVDLQAPSTFADVQRFAFTLAPRNRSVVRRIAVGRKKMPDAHVREGHWAYVDRLSSAADIMADLGGGSYTTKTRGTRRYQSEAIELASGTYAIAAHRDHAHLLYELEPESVHDDAKTLLSELRIVPWASYVAAVVHPDARWRRRTRVAPRDRPGDDRMGDPAEEDIPPFSEPSLYDDPLMERFGRRSYARLEPAFLDHEGTELVLIGGGASRLATPGGSSPAGALD